MCGFCFGLGNENKQLKVRDDLVNYIQLCVPFARKMLITVIPLTN